MSSDCRNICSGTALCISNSASRSRSTDLSVRERERAHVNNEIINYLKSYNRIRITVKTPSKENATLIPFRTLQRALRFTTLPLYSQIHSRKKNDESEQLFSTLDRKNELIAVVRIRAHIDPDNRIRECTFIRCDPERRGAARSDSPAALRSSCSGSHLLSSLLFSSRTTNIIFPAPAHESEIDIHHASPRQPYEQLRFHSNVPNHQARTLSPTALGGCPRYHHHHHHRQCYITTSPPHSVALGPLVFFARARNLANCVPPWNSPWNSCFACNAIRVDVTVCKLYVKRERDERRGTQGVIGVRTPSGPGSR